MGGSNDNFAKTICSICYEDLKPIVEDLQAISICGHVFHELCLQQWFEYCTKSKKQSCPVCKQGCTAKNVGRLYFQSVGDSVLSQSQIPVKISDDGDRPEVLRRDVKRLENKVSGLVSSLDEQQKEVQNLTTELHACKAQLSKEVTLKTEALRQKECIQSLLQTKSSDLVKSSLECSRLQEKNLELAKEIAALKLVSDCNLEEEEIVKLASLGNESNTRDAIDVLKKSLFIRNKSYKELMAKCNTIGRGEARSLKKLEKAKEKIIKLKTRIRELETTIEARENEALRHLKDSSKRNQTDFTTLGVAKTTNPTIFFKQTESEEKSPFPPSVINLDEDGSDNSFEVKEITGNVFSVNDVKTDNKGTVSVKETSLFECLTDNEDEQQKSVATSKFDRYASFQEAGSSTRVFDSFSKDVQGLSPQDIKQVHQPSPVLLAEPGDRCFAAGLLGPDGANTYLGKWCKRASNKGSVGSNNGLISVGADGRGGRIKVLRSTANQTAIDAKESMAPAKKLKTEHKSNNHPTRGCLQIEHFFGKAPN